MKEMTTDLDQGADRPTRAPDRVRLMHQERSRIQENGGSVESQQWLYVGKRWVIRTHYTVSDDTDKD